MQDIYEQQVLRGGWADTSLYPLESWRPRSKQLLIFVSSTFTDTHLERNILMEKILPRLQEEAQPFEITITFTDMRYGVRDENTRDHKTWYHCKKELERCRRDSAGLFFLSLQGDKYGFRPLPRSIDRAVLDELTATLKWRLEVAQSAPSSPSLQGIVKESPPSSPDREDHTTALSRSQQDASEILQLLQYWYTLDDNAQPPEYLLRELQHIGDANFWQDTVPRLRNALNDLPFDRDDSSLRIGQSVTEWETRFALRYVTGDSENNSQMIRSSALRIAWLHRSFEEDLSKDSDHLALLTDTYSDLEAKERLQTLKKLLGDTLDAKVSALESSSSSSKISKEALLSSRPILVRCVSSSEYFEQASLQSMSLEKSFSSSITPRLLSELSIGLNHHALLEQPSTPYISHWEEVAYQRLHQELESLIQVEKQQQDESARLLQEMYHHCVWAVQKATTFVGRHSIQTRVVELIDAFRSENAKATKSKIKSTVQQFSPMKPTTRMSPITLAIVAQSGCGKTALMARIAQTLYLQELSLQSSPNISAASTPLRPVIVRFCGTTAGSSDAMSLIQSISQQIAWIYGQGMLPVASDYETAVTQFHWLMKQYPVLLFLDSLDQLSNDYEGRSRLTFLEGIDPHPASRIIVSTLPDDVPTLDDGTRSSQQHQYRYFYQCDTRLQEWKVPRLVLTKLSSGDPSEDPSSSALASSTDVTAPAEYEVMIREILQKQYRRTCNPRQWEYLLRQVASEPTVLYLQLACRVVATWTSFENGVELASGVHGAIDQIFTALEQEYGRALTRCALGCLTFARAGIRDNEMQDLLSLDNTVLDEVFQYSSLATKRLPFHVWARLRSALDGLVVEKQDGCLRWYHRQLQEVATVKYEAEQSQRRYLMAQYFGNLVPAELRASRLIAVQPLLLSSTSAAGDAMEEPNSGLWLLAMSANRISDLSANSQQQPICVINRRRCIESTAHLSHCATANLLSAHEWQRSIETVCQLDYICACVRAGTLVDLLHHLGQMNSECSTNKNVQGFVPEECIQRLDDYYTWLRANLSLLLRDVHGPAPQMVYTAMRYTNNRRCIVSLDAKVLLTQQFRRQHISNHGSHHLAHKYEWAKLSTLRVRLVDREQTLIGHKHAVKGVVFSSQHLRLASFSWKTINLWDSEAGACVMTLSGHAKDILAITLTPDGQTLISVSADKTMKIWSTETGQCLATLSGHHTKEVTAVACSPDSSSLVTGSRDRSLRFWIRKILPGSSSNVGLGWATTERVVASAHKDDILCLEYHPRQPVLASGSADKTIKLWQTNTGQCIVTLVGHKAEVTAVVFYLSEDRRSTRLLSAGGTVLKVWDTTRGICLATLQGHHSAILSASVRTLMTAQQTRVLAASASRDGTVKLWQLVDNDNDGEEHTHHKVSMGSNASNVARNVCVATLTGHNGYVTSVQFSPDGSKLASSSLDRSIKLWDVDNYLPSGSVGSLSTALSSMTMTSGTSYGQSSMSDQDEHEGQVHALTFSADGTKVVSVGSVDKAIKIWDKTSGACLQVFKGHSQGVTCVACCPLEEDGSYLASGSSDQTIKIWNTFSKSCTATLVGHTDEITCLTFASLYEHPAATTIVELSSVSLLATSRQSSMASSHTSRSGESLYFQPESLQSILVSGARDRTVRLWRDRSASALPSNDPSSKLHVDGQLLGQNGALSTEDDETDRFECLLTLEGPESSAISCLTTYNETPTTLLVAAGTEDGTVFVWEIVQAQEVQLQQDLALPLPPPPPLLSANNALAKASLQRDSSTSSSMSSRSRDNKTTTSTTSTGHSAKKGTPTKPKWLLANCRRILRPAHHGSVSSLSFLFFPPEATNTNSMSSTRTNIFGKKPPIDETRQDNCGQLVLITAGAQDETLRLWTTTPNPGFSWTPDASTTSDVAIDAISGLDHVVDMTSQTLLRVIHWAQGNIRQIAVVPDTQTLVVLTATTIVSFELHLHRPPILPESFTVEGPASASSVDRKTSIATPPSIQPPGPIETEVHYVIHSSNTDRSNTHDSKGQKANGGSNSKSKRKGYARKPPLSTTPNGSNTTTGPSPNRRRQLRPVSSQQNPQVADKGESLRVLQQVTLFDDTCTALAISNKHSVVVGTRNGAILRAHSLI